MKYPKVIVSTAALTAALLAGTAGSAIAGTALPDATHAGEQTAERTISVGGNPVGIAQDAPRRIAYVAASADAAVNVIDTEAGTVTRTIATTGSPQEVRLNASGDLLYVASEVNDGFDTAVDVIDTEKGTVINTATGLIADAALATNPSTGTVYAASRSTLQIFDAALKTEKTISLPITGVNAIAVSPDGSKLFLSGRGAVTAVDATSGNVLRTTQYEEEGNMGKAARFGIVVDASGPVFVLTAYGHIVSIDGETGALLDSGHLFGNMEFYGLAIDDYVLYAVQNDGTKGVVQVLSKQFFSSKESISVGHGPRAICVDQTRGEVLVTNYDDATVSQFSAV